MIKALLRGGLMLLVLLGLLVLLALTPFGLQFTLWAGAKIIPGELTYQSVSGVLMGPIDIKGLVYQSDAQRITIKKLEVNWHPSYLFAGEFAVSKLTVNHFSVYPADNNKDSITQADHSQWPLPLDLSIKKADINAIQIYNKQNQLQYAIKQLQFSGRLSEKQLDFSAKANWTSPKPWDMQFSIKGRWQDYQVDFAIQGPHMNAELSGSGDDRGINLSIEKNDLLKGRLSGHIRAKWVPYWQWDIAIDAQRLDLALLNDEWSTRLNATVKTVGSWKTKLPLFDLHVLFNDQSTAINIQLDHHKQWKAEWMINSKALRTLMPGIYGTLKSKGQASAVSWQDFNSQGDLTLQRFREGDLHIDHLQAKWKLNNQNADHSQLQLQAKHIDRSGIVFDALSMVLKGNSNQHNVQAKIISQDNHIALNLTGHWNPNQKTWRAKINNTTVDLFTHQRWVLEHPAILTLAPEHWHLSAFCLLGPKKGDLCLQGDWQLQTAWRSVLKGRNVSAGLLVGLLTGNVQVQGRVDMKASVDGTGKAIDTANWSIKLKPGLVKNKVSGKVISIPYQKMAITGAVNELGLQGQFDLQLGQDDYVKAQLAIPGFTTSKDLLAESMQGEVDIQWKKLLLLSVLLPDGVQPRGELFGKLTIAGSLGKPSITGKLALKRGQIQVPDLGVTFRHATLDLRGQGNKLKYTFQGTSGSRLTVKGDTELASGFPTTLKISGKNILLANTPEYKIYATPDLTLVSNPKVTELTGTLHIPRALLRPRNFSNTVTLPENEMTIVGGEGDNLDQSELNINMRFSLGDHVKVNSNGLRGQLTGDLRIESQPGKGTIANGKISVVKGVYELFGRKLHILPNSSVQYLRSPLSNPQLDISAVRYIKTFNSVSGFSSLGSDSRIVVGAKILGTLRHHRVKFFSIPAGLSKSDIISYLVFGSASGGGGGLGALLQAVGSAPIGSGRDSQGVVQKLQSSLGLSEFGVESQTAVDSVGAPVGDQTAFVVGKRLWKNLYIRYRYGIGENQLDNMNILELEYRLNENWMLRVATNLEDNKNQDIATTGLGSGVDVLYTMQR